MRILVIILLVGAAFAGVTAFSGLNDRMDDRDARDAARASAARKALRDAPYNFKQVVFGPGEAGSELRFRGRAALPGGAMSAVYGVVDLTCPTESDAKCWRLRELYLDGDPVILAAGPVEPPAAEAPAAAPEPPPEDDPAGAAPGPEISLAAEPVDPAPAAAPPMMSHKVRLPTVNVRSGPSTEDDVVMQLTMGTELHLLERRGSWGRFRIAGRAEGPDEAWIALRVLEEL